VSKHQLELIFPANLIKEPVIYEMAKKIDVVFNIRRARVTAKIGEIILELEGSDAVLAEAEAFLTAKGLNVQPVTGSTVES
jgi:L-aspartate semialdehyde sulfurtransferase ferredoxin